jgi:hypothetical protein
MELLTDTKVDDRYDIPIWLTVEVTAAVGIDRSIDAYARIPLDVVVVVDNS